MPIMRTIRNTGSATIAAAGAPRRARPRRGLPPVVIEQVRANDQDVADGERIELPAGTRKLDFQYAGLSFQMPRLLRYRHRPGQYVGIGVQVSEHEDGGITISTRVRKRLAPSTNAAGVSWLSAA